jgi:hypothetical protein
MTVWRTETLGKSRNICIGSPILADFYTNSLLYWLTFALATRCIGSPLYWLTFTGSPLYWFSSVRIGSTLNWFTCVLSQRSAGSFLCLLSSIGSTLYCINLTGSPLSRGSTVYWLTYVPVHPCRLNAVLSHLFTDSLLYPLSSVLSHLCTGSPRVLVDFCTYWLISLLARHCTAPRCVTSRHPPPNCLSKIF